MEFCMRLIEKKDNENVTSIQKSSDLGRNRDWPSRASALHFWAVISFHPNSSSILMREGNVSMKKCTIDESLWMTVFL